MTDLQLSIDEKGKYVISPEIAWSYRLIPSRVTDDFIDFFIDESKYSESVSDELEILTGKKINLLRVESDRIEQALNLFYLRSAAKTPSAAFSQRDKEFFPQLISEARKLKSSDIHMEIYEQRCRVRFRIDGKLIERVELNKSDYPAAVNRIKIMAGLDISEKRLPQDGRIFFTSESSRFDIRVSILPTLYGEKIVLRILGTDAVSISLESLGFSGKDYHRYLETIKKPSGIILISGPTGSGKTTTLYATLKLLNKGTENIVTTEDPVEYTLEGINQVQVKEDLGLTFARVLRSFLRQDPDIIMVGEIRDAETANLAIRAALTGHLVLSTIHTNSAWGTISRLADMGIPPYLLSTTMNATLAQRLLRLLCPACKQRVETNTSIFPEQFRKKNEVLHHYKQVGCTECYYTGYKGRKAIYELIVVDAEIAEHINNNSNDVAAIFKMRDIKTLQDEAFALFKEGHTSIDEIYPLLLHEVY